MFSDYKSNILEQTYKIQKKIIKKKIKIHCNVSTETSIVHTLVCFLEVFLYKYIHIHSCNLDHNYITIGYMPLKSLQKEVFNSKIIFLQLDIHLLNK